MHTQPVCSPGALPAPPKREPSTALVTPRLLVVEDDADLLPILARVIERIDHEIAVDWASSADDARGALAAERYVAVLADYMLGDSDTGLELRGDCMRLQPGARFALMSALPIALPGDSCPFLQKPFSMSECQHFLTELMRRK